MKISTEYVDYGVKLEKLSDEQKANLIGPHEIVMSFIKGAMSQKYPKGLPNDKLRMLNTISKKFDAAQAESNPEVALNSYEMLFIRDAYKDAQFDVNNMQGATATYNAIFPEVESGIEADKTTTETIGS